MKPIAPFVAILALIWASASHASIGCEIGNTPYGQTFIYADEGGTGAVSFILKDGDIVVVRSADIDDAVSANWEYVYYQPEEGGTFQYDQGGGWVRKAYLASCG